MKKFIYILCTIFVLLVGKTAWANDSNPWYLDPAFPLAYQIETSNNVIEVCDTYHGKHSNCQNANQIGFQFNDKPTRITFSNHGQVANFLFENNFVDQCSIVMNNSSARGIFSRCSAIT